MKVSYKWLAEYVDLKGITPEEVANLLTFAGVEVESITPLAQGTNLVIGQIVSCLPHPDSDHLHVLKVDEGEKYGVVQIVCGAPNAREGLKVIVARPGAVLPEITIKPSKIRGVESNGMCCSLLELGVDKKYLEEKQIAGIEELDSSAKVGDEDVLSYLQLDDVTLDLKLLANRPDLNAMIHVAEEVATLTHRALKLPVFEEIKGEAPEIKPAIATEKCSRFALAEVSDVHVLPSPLYLKRRLMACGVRSINNVVDIGNYAMLLTGQPFNMYDKDKLEGNTLVAEDDIEGSWTAMDEKEYRLEKGDICIASNHACMCLGGIMTSLTCTVTEKSKNIVVESALFDGASIRHTSSRLGLASESSSRFVKGLGESQEEALSCALSLLKELTSPSKVSSLAFAGKVKSPKKVIQTSLEYMNNRLGTSFSEEEVIRTLNSESFLTEKRGDSLFVTVPSSRIDVEGEADISEEVIRLLGYENVPEREMVLPGNGGYSEEQKRERAIRRMLRHLGVNEVLTYSLLPLKEENTYSALLKGKHYQILNPLTEDRLIYRHSLLPSLLSVLSYNASRQKNDLAVFEISEVAVEGRSEKHLGIALSGEENIISMLERRPYDFFTMKGYLEGILSLLGIKNNRVRYERLGTEESELHPGRSVKIYLGKELIAIMGELHPLEKKKREVKNAIVMELNLSSLLNVKGSQNKASIPARFPFTRRDLALICKEEVSFQKLKEEALHASSYIKDVFIFDVYHGEAVEKGKKSLALAFFLQDENKTLKEEEINEAMTKVMHALETKFAAEVRK